MTETLAPTTAATDVANFHSVMVVEGVRTTDNREFAAGSLSWRTLPIPLMLQRETAERHQGAVIAGKITRIMRQGNEIHGWGTFDMGSPDGREAQRLVAEQIMRGVSIDAELMEIDKEQLVGADDGSDPVLYVLEGRIGALTMCAFPAFPQAVIALDSAEIGPATSNGRGEALPPVDPSGYASNALVGFTVSTKAWDGSSSRYDDAQWERAAAGRRGGTGSVKSEAFLPHHEPDGSVSRAGVHNAAARFNQVQAPASAKQRARGHLLSHYRNDLKEKAPTVLTSMALVAHAEQEGPPAEWFEDPELKGLTPFTVARSGRVYGHLAGFDSCHIGFKECMKAPRSRTGYAHFKIGQVFASGCDCDEGIPTGVIVLGTGHADVFATPSAARNHYDNSGQGVCDVNIGEDEYGIWVAGALRPGVTDAQIRALRGSALSGDWRYIGGNMELISALAVNVPGFVVPRTSAGIESGVQVSLVAAGISEDEITPIEEVSSGVAPADIIAELKKEQAGKDEADQDSGQDTSAEPPSSTQDDDVIPSP